MCGSRLGWCRTDFGVAGGRGERKGMPLVVPGLSVEFMPSVEFIETRLALSVGFTPLVEGT